MLYSPTKVFGSKVIDWLSSIHYAVAGMLNLL